MRDVIVILAIALLVGALLIPLLTQTTTPRCAAPVITEWRPVWDFPDFSKPAAYEPIYRCVP